MIKNYIFDFGNVLGEFYPERLTAPYVEDLEERRIVSEVAFDRLYWDRLDDGSITDEEVKDGIRSRLPKPLAEKGCTVYDNWIRSMTPVPQMEELIEDIAKTDKKLFLISNISTGFAENYGEVQWIDRLFSHFDGLVFSGVVKLLKPHAEIFEYLLNKYDLKAEECLFIDDNAANIQGAKSAGIGGYLFDGDAKKLREYMNL